MQADSEQQLLAAAHRGSKPSRALIGRFPWALIFDEEYIPNVDDEIKVGEYSIKIIEATSSKIEKVLLKKIDIE